MEDAGKGLGYFFLGLGAGVAVGMLSAPRSGTATRNYLQTTTREGTDYLKQQGQDLVDGATETIDRGKQKLRSQVNNLSDAVDVGKQAYRETVETTPFANPKT
jgi:gas vesicle protein